MMTRREAREHAHSRERVCPQCGSREGTPVYYDFGVDRDTGYVDAGEGCTECMAR